MVRFLNRTVGALAIAAALSCAFAPSAQAQVSDPSRAALRAARVDHRVPAMTAAVWKDDAIIWTAADGFADLELGVKASDETRFRLGSVSKIFTASLTAKLAAQGRVDLDQPIRGWMPSLPDTYDGVTLRMLLGHLGGVRHYQGKDFDLSAPGGMIDLRWYPDTASALALFINDPLVGAPGEMYSYSTFGYTLIGAALEAATGETFAALLRAEVLGPLGLEDTAVDAFREIVPNRARPYDVPSSQLGEEGRGARNAAPLNSAYKVPGGGMVATASDVARFGAAHFAPGFLPEAIFEATFTPQTNGAGEAIGVGLGWRVGADEAGRRIFHHAGSQQGCRAMLMVYPDERVAVAVLGNLTGTPRDIAAVAQAIAAPFLNESE